MSVLWPYLLTAVCLLYQLAAEDVPDEEQAPCIQLTIEDTSNNIIYKEYYKDGDVVTVKCEYGYQPTSELLTCGSYSYPREWNPSSITCIARCTRPAGVPKESTSNGENVEVTVQCESGYYPTSESITCGSSNNPREWNPTSITCIARCTRPAIENMDILPEDKEYYNEGDEVTVECKSGYSPASEKIRCGIPGNPQEWNPPSITCIAQCKKPEGKILRRDPEKDFYNEGDTFTVTCQHGYRPSQPVITCVSPGTDNEWDHTPRCIAQCKRPDGNKWKKDLWKEFYSEYEYMTEYCQVGYQPSPSTVRCVNRGAADNWENPPQCLAQCKKPDGNILKRDPDKEFYNEGDTVTVTCQRGYRPSRSIIKCVSSRATTTQWNYTHLCIVQCKRPDGVILNMDPRKEFYNKGVTVTVKCQVGYQPSPSTVTCVNEGAADFWDNPPQCIAQCAKPTIQNVLSMTEDRSYYNVGEELRVQCKHGYDPSSETMRCNNYRQWNLTITCTALCKKPDGTILTMDPEKDYYRNGDSVTVKCEIGYRPSHSSVQCVNRGATNEWNYPPQCIAQCARPAIRNMKNLDGYKEYYYKYEVISVQCDSGYYPSSPTMRCITPRTPQEWTHPTITCTEVTMTDWRITSTSISVRISCNPQCPDTWRFTVQCCAEPNTRSCETSSGGSATFTDLQPNSLYRINTKWGQYSLEMEYIRTGESVPGKLEIMKVPSMEDKTIRWSLSDTRGTITGFQVLEGMLNWRCERLLW